MDALKRGLTKIRSQAVQHDRHREPMDPKRRLRALVVIRDFGYATINAPKGDGEAELVPFINPRKNDTVANAKEFEALLSENADAVLKREKGNLRKLMKGVITFAAAYRLDGANKAFVFDFKLIGKRRNAEEEGEKIRLVASACKDADILALEIYRKAASEIGPGRIYLSLKDKGNFI